ncbi:hypothetical protein ACHAQA_000732 [Verticillium albo-atrum]
MSRFFPHTAFAEDQPLAHTILWTHILTRAVTTGSVLGLGIFAVRSTAGRKIPTLAYPASESATIRASTTLPKTATASASPTTAAAPLKSAGSLRAARLLGTVGTATVAMVGLTALATIPRMWGREEIEWQDRSWRLRANPFQTEVDDWTYGASLAALAVAGVRFRKEVARLGWRGVNVDISMASDTVPRKLWEHPNPKSTQMWKFIQEVNQKYSLNLQTFQDLYAWSCDNRALFYGHVFTFANIIHSGTATSIVDESAPIDAIPQWFPGIHLNFAENLLHTRTASDPQGHRGTKDKEDDKVALTEVREGNSAVRSIKWGQLRRDAGKLASAMKARGVSKGDRIVLVGANSYETLLVLTAATWLGAVFSSSSTDMGVSGILQRTVQVDPKFIFFDDAALYNGKTVDLREKMAGVAEGMKDCEQFTNIVSIRRFDEALDVTSIHKAETLDHFLESASSTPPPFEHVAFQDPFLIYYSSGTTGTPKAIVHAVGNILLSINKESRLHEDITPSSVGLQYTTTGWIMYLANIAQLLFGARAVLYDGSPFQPDLTTFIRIMAEQKITKLGTSPRWLFEIAKAGIKPRELVDLSSLGLVSATGMVLSDQLFDWFYEEGFPRNVHLANISGGTDIAGCFGLMNPLTPVYRGGTQGPSLGVPIAIYDAQLPDGPGKPVPNGIAGELVATAAFPNIPIYLWGDKPAQAGAKTLNTAPPGSRYHAAYFNRFTHVWAHGDFCAVHPQTGNVTFLGRADGVLNPSGVRFGSAEIYAVVERGFADRVADSLCVGQRRANDTDESVMLFLMMRPGCAFDSRLVADVRAAIGRELTKRHVPRWVFETPEIPTTVNLKKVELPVKQIVSGHTIKPSGTLLNPKSLDFYYQFAKVEELVAGKGKL